jgi:deoxyribose-phosphate aldolase
MPETDVDLARRALRLLDLTELGDAATEADVLALCTKARGSAVLPAVAAVCVWPRHVAVAKAELEGQGIRVATVVNFPAGESDEATVLAETADALAAGADEIDLVLPWRRFLAGEEAQAEAFVRATARSLPPGIRLKVILESGGYPDMSSVRRAADAAIRAGAHFVKTSTGKAGTGATLDAARAMLNAILSTPRAIGLKPSGGIRTLEDARGFLALADDMMGPGWATPETFRFGASGLHGALASVIAGEATKPTIGNY